ncbi:MAG: Fic/DOC family N-terminal domain-containing protein [Methylocella sp.]
MDSSAFSNPAGNLASTIQAQKAFIPSRLPPKLDLSSMQQNLSTADQKLGELRGVGRYLSNPYLLIRPLQRKEAIASSNIEGTYTSLPELLLLESGAEDRKKNTDTQEVLNYVRALQDGIELLSEIPISNRLIMEIHKKLLYRLPKTRTGYYEPGEYRKQQNFIGSSKDVSKSRFNPPPPPVHIDCMRDLEIFINLDDMAGLPPLVFIALIHYQFETIHPFPDGNGRVGRILIPLILRSRNVMDQPLLYMSQYFEDNRDEYIKLMFEVSSKCRWAEWISFFLNGVGESCEKTIVTIHKVRELRELYKGKCHLARSSALLLAIIDEIFDKLYVTVPAIQNLTETSYTAARNNIAKLVEHGILKEFVHSGRMKFYVATELMSLFES